MAKTPTKKVCKSAVINKTGKKGRVILAHRPSDAGKFQGNLFARIADAETKPPNVLANYVQVTVPDADAKRAVLSFALIPGSLAALEKLRGAGATDGILSITLTNVAGNTITSLTYNNGNGVVQVLCNNHGFQNNNTVAIQGVQTVGYNGNTNIVTVVDANNFTYPLAPGQNLAADNNGGTAALSVNAITSASEDGQGNVTIVTAAPHGFNPGDLVTVANFNTAATTGYNGTFAVNVTAPGSNQFTYVNPTLGLPSIANTGSVTSSVTPSASATSPGGIPVQQDAPVDYVDDPSAPACP